MGAAENMGEEGPLHENEPESSYVGKKPGPWPSKVDSLPSDHGYIAKNLGNWARRTGYRSGASEESRSDVEMNMSTTGYAPAAPPVPKPARYVEPPLASSNLPPMSRDPESNVVHANGLKEPERVKNAPPPGQSAAPPGPFVPGKRGNESENVSGVQSAATSGPIRIEPLRLYKDSEADVMSQSQDGDDYLTSKHSHMKYELCEHPGVCKSDRCLIVLWLMHRTSIARSTRVDCA